MTTLFVLKKSLKLIWLTLCCMFWVWYVWIVSGVLLGFTAGTDAWAWWMTYRGLVVSICLYGIRLLCQKDGIYSKDSPLGSLVIKMLRRI
jgi:hypothetical protein